METRTDHRGFVYEIDRQRPDGPMIRRVHATLGRAWRRYDGYCLPGAHFTPAELDEPQNVSHGAYRHEHAFGATVGGHRFAPGRCG